VGEDDALCRATTGRGGGVSSGPIGNGRMAHGTTSADQRKKWKRRTTWTREMKRGGRNIRIGESQRRESI
jgi:hypothetical protein